MLSQLKQSLQNGLRISVKVTPKSQRNKIVECEFNQETSQFQLKIKVRGVPEKGQVNQNLIEFLAKELDLPVSNLTIISGLSSRQKIIQFQ